MINYAFLAGGIISTANKLNNLRNRVDVYPEKLSPIVESIKNSIDSKTYEFLTNQNCNEEPNNPAIEYITGNLTKVVKFKKCSNFIVKTSKVGLYSDIRKKNNEGPFGWAYAATNNHGGVTRGLFRYPRRVVEAKKLRRIIKKNHLDKIQIPKKYLCSFPKNLVPKFSTPLYNRHVFILCEKCDVEYTEENTRKELQKMSENDMQTLANQIHIFFSKSGVLDFLPHNYYIKDGKLVIFDTEPMSLTFIHLFCVSPTLRAARINFKNLERNFTEIPEAKILVDEAKRSIKQIRTQEREKFPHVVCITLIFLGTVVLLNHYNLLLF